MVKKFPYNAAAWRAGIAQLVEHNLAMVRVASSNLVSRSRFKLSFNKGKWVPRAPFFVFVLCKNLTTPSGSFFVRFS